MVLATKIHTFTKKSNKNISETSKVLKVLKNETDTIAVIYQGKRIILKIVEGFIEVKEISENFSAKVAGEIVKHYQMLYDSLKWKLAKA